MSDTRTLREHELKCWPDFFAKVITGEKTFEVRRDDRGFRGGDVLWPREWRFDTKQYTGRECRVRVTYLLAGAWPGLDDGYVVMAIALLNQQEAASGWQPIETAPKDEPVWFWIVPKSPEEAYCNTSGDPIFSTHAPYRRFGKYGTWCALSKAIYWSPAPPDPPTPSGAKE